MKILLILHLVYQTTLKYEPQPVKNTTRDGGSTALYTAYTVDMVSTVDIVYTIQIALHCLKSSIHAYILFGKVRTNRPTCSSASAHHAGDQDHWGHGSAAPAWSAANIKWDWGGMVVVAG